MSSLVDLESLVRIVDACQARGMDFVEVFVQHQDEAHMIYDNGQADRVWTGVDLGVGVRLVSGSTVVYTTLNSLDPDEIGQTAAQATSAMRSLGDGGPPVYVRHESRRTRGDSEELFLPSELLDVCERIDREARGFSSSVRQVKTTLSATRRRILVVNSEGHIASNDQYLTVARAAVVAINGQRREMGSYSPARASSLRNFMVNESPESIGKQAAHLAVVQLDARPAPTGTMSVVVGNGRGGALIHEACVHPLEGDFIGRENSVYRGRLGEMIASPIVTVLDDAVQCGDFPGSFRCDDEGTVGQTNVLVEKGRLCSYLTDRTSAGKLGHRLTGNGRRQSYEFLPLPRMTNTFIAPGDDLPEDIIKATQRGIYAKQVAGGEVNQVTGEFVFNVSEGYLIEDGRITAPLLPTTLVGNGPDVLKNIDMVGNDLALAAAFCGKSGQVVMVGVGQPTIRVREMVVGGTQR